MILSFLSQYLRVTRSELFVNFIREFLSALLCGMRKLIAEHLKLLIEFLVLRN